MIGRALGVGIIAAPFISALLYALCAPWRRFQRRREARAAEQCARPHSAHAGTAQQDAAAVLLQVIREQCKDWANPHLGGSYEARVRDQSVANAAGIILGLIDHHERKQQR